MAGSKPDERRHRGSAHVNRSLLWVMLAIGGAVLTLWMMRQAPSTPEDPPAATTVFECRKILIGLDQASCREDIQGPGVLTVTFTPDPLQTSWEVGVRGLATLADTCEFHGRFDQTRLSNLQGRGATALRCPIDATTNRQYHEISVTSRLDTPGTSLTVTLTLAR